MKREISDFLKYAGMSWRDKKARIGALVFGLLAVALNLAYPYLAKLTVESITSRSGAAAYIFFTVLTALAYILAETASALTQTIERSIKIRLNLDLRAQLLAKMAELKLAWFREKSSGGNVYRIDNDVEAVSNSAADFFPQAFFLSVRTIGLLSIIFYLNWRMALFFIFAGLIMAAVSFIFSRKMRPLWDRLAVKREKDFTAGQELFSLIYLLKAFGREKADFGRLLERYQNTARLEQDNLSAETVNSIVLKIFSKILLGGAVFYGGLQVIYGRISAGDLAAIAAYLNQLSEIHESFLSHLSQYGAGLISSRRISEILSEEAGLEEQGGTVCKTENFDLEIKALFFSYNTVPLLEGVNLYIKEGSHFALSGPSGCGKSTLINLILKLYQPQKGEILLGGRNIREWVNASYKNLFACAVQEPLLFNDTIENNIKYAKPDASQSEIEEAAAIADLNLGLKTVIGEDAAKISQGQKQKIAIARAVLKKPKILILDEAFSNINVDSELIIMARLKETLKHCTIISVSHRLLSVQSADQVFYYA